MARPLYFSNFYVDLWSNTMLVQRSSGFLGEVERIQNNGYNWTFLCGSWDISVRICASLFAYIYLWNFRWPGLISYFSTSRRCYI
ncbi:unnamed protein product [Leptidea sinapis]|uniref:Uncharacterized protein n=1 Tax=Leptidea sinapis TaxID=189913 RepID=A0A5E4Q0A6_9NEOP|nr:unnamed protein product [Leptidea sinapis]